MSTPIQRRLAVNRKRSQGIVQLVAAGGFAVLALVDVLLRGYSAVLLVLLAVLAAGWLIIGLVSLRHACRQREQLEAEVGKDAGAQ